MIAPDTIILVFFSNLFPPADKKLFLTPSLQEATPFSFILKSYSDYTLIIANHFNLSRAKAAFAA
jgi:hypothetical protein